MLLGSGMLKEVKQLLTTWRQQRLIHFQAPHLVCQLQLAIRRHVGVHVVPEAHEVVLLIPEEARLQGASCASSTQECFAAHLINVLGKAQYMPGSDTAMH